MKQRAAGLAMALATLVAAASSAFAAEQVPVPYPTGEESRVENAARSRRLDVDVWINKDEGGIYRPGESMRVYFRGNADSYMLVFNIDTDGYIHLVYPYGPGDTPSVEGGRTYMIPSRSDPYDLVADGPPGIEYVVAVGSPYPFQDLPWYLSADADGGRPEGDYDGEDDTESGRIVGDPYVGIDRILHRIAAPGREDLLATNETYFYIGRRVEYPRYVCADCHYHPYYFDPYVTACSAFDIRIDATWAHYAPLRIGAVRPRYIYRVRPQAPTRYRQWKQQWSSLDGRATLRTRFLPERDVRYRREREPRIRPTRPEFRDLRRYREGRFWRGRDEILRLRERRDRVGPPPDRSARQRQEDRPGGRDVRDRERRPPEDRGYRDRGRPRPPADGGDSPGTPPDDRRGRDRERARPPEEDRGAKERRPPDRQEERGDRGGSKRDGQDRGDRNRGRDDRDRGDHGKNDDNGDNGRRGDERPNRR
ncbi:MAG: DUF4384 domain-containing protein [Candidatus Eisenbacteria bacterium]|uniref:DUF4384 domain-containing protein n=1 Tax=Eiseniibacteriota bacterium TaxID=2212470 RepID=A0A538SUT5_UNCEI|nr:MAG: DUF4384 domain-containing protein [Candidatus Eisenbacteria bacterium]TMQ66570.1 MAG: DUF4384 domain-containing protein [Candidatus Eisenbacteria bacterium]